MEKLKRLRYAAPLLSLSLLLFGLVACSDNPDQPTPQIPALPEPPQTPNTDPTPDLQPMPTNINHNTILAPENIESFHVSLTTEIGDTVINSSGNVIGQYLSTTTDMTNEYEIPLKSGNSINIHSTNPKVGENNVDIYQIDIYTPDNSYLFQEVYARDTDISGKLSYFEILGDEQGNLISGVYDISSDGILEAVADGNTVYVDRDGDGYVDETYTMQTTIDFINFIMNSRILTPTSGKDA